MVVMKLIVRALRRFPACTIVIAQHTAGYRTAALGPVLLEDSRLLSLLTPRRHLCWSVPSLWEFRHCKGPRTRELACSEWNRTPTACVLEATPARLTTEKRAQPPWAWSLIGQYFWNAPHHTDQ